MNIFEFIIYQQIQYPGIIQALIPLVLGSCVLGGIGTFFITMFHGWPTQGIIWTKHDAAHTPWKQYKITGTLKQEQDALEKRNKVRRKNWDDFVKWAYTNRYMITFAFLCFFFVYFITWAMGLL